MTKVNEIWSQIPGYEGLYEVSNMGRVKSLCRNDSIGRPIQEKIMHPYKAPNGYVRINLCKNGEIKMHSVHKLVATAFLGECPIGFQVNHKDEVKTNNTLSNLEYLSAKENTNWGTGIQRRAEAQKNNKNRSKSVICIETGIVYPSIREAERQTGLRHNEISSCCRGKAKTTGGYHWKWVDGRKAKGVKRYD